ncbi:Hypothetical protein CCH01_014270 [Clostridium chauvoei JF4335]|nr:Hypothetical protein CCH01_014270 [Clostridium chauvoei JF4335]
METLDNIFLSIFKATLPGNVVPPFSIVFVRKIVIFEARMLNTDLILIVFTTL